MRKSGRIMALALALIMLLGARGALASGMFPSEGEVVTLTVYSQLANYSGMQAGWSSALMKDKFGIELNIVPDLDGVYETRVTSGNLGDIVVWGSNGTEYKNAIDKGMLLNWEEDDMLKTYAPYIYAHYQDALESNREISGTGEIYGFGHDVAFSEAAHKAFFYTWDIRWDLYKQLGYPDVTDLDSMIELFKKMKEICPTDDKGNETYAISLWPDWDGNMVMYVKAMATAYYGYDELALGLYNSETGEFYDALMENGPYLNSLKFFNKLYQNNLLDPNSMTQTYELMAEKVKNGGTFFSIFNYAGSMTYNTDAHMADGKMMYTRSPDDAMPLAYGMGTTGGNRIWSIGADCEYPELCLTFIDWLATPEGSLTMWYGPKGLTWDYNEEGGMYFTPLGKLCNNDSKHDLTGVEWVSPFTGKSYTLSGNFNDGCIQINNSTLPRDMVNPEGKLGEAFNKDTWVSELTAVTYDIQKDWREWSGVTLSEQYLEARPYKVIPDVPYAESVRDDMLEVTWEQVKKAIRTYSWRAIYAKTDAEYDFHVREMRRVCNGYGYDECVKWSQNEAAIKFALQQEH